MPSSLNAFQGGVIVNSLPKSGTHLLERGLMILGLRNWHTTRGKFRRVTDRIGITPPPFLAHLTVERWNRAHFQTSQPRPSGNKLVPIGVFSPEYLDPRTVSKWIAPRTPSSFVKAHIPYSAAFAEVINSCPNVRAITIIRDPRAVAASMIPYVLNAKQWKHSLQDYFETLTNEQRVDFVLNGGYADPPGLTVLSLATAFENVLDWQKHAGSLVIRFEDLVGEQGGGSFAAQVDTFEAITDHLGIALTPEMRARMDEVFDPSSPTFRGGRIDSWRERLSPGQVARIEAALGPELFARAGYAVDAG